MQAAALAILGLVVLLSGLVLSIILPGLRAYAWAILAVGAAVIAAAAAMDFRRLRGALSSRRGKAGIGASVKAALFAGIVILVNAIGLGVYHRFDLSSLSQFTLTAQTREVLGKLEEPVEAVNFFTPSVDPAVASYARSLLAEYQDYTRRITVRDVDPELNPDQARLYGVDQLGARLGVTVFRSREGVRQVYGPQISAEAEHAFTSAILEVTGTRQKAVYFLTGHGERSIQDDFALARSGLRDNLFQVQELDLQRQGSVPADAAVLVAAGPREAYSAGEVSVLSGWLERGGRLLLMLDPGSPAGLGKLVSAWGLDLADGTMIDAASYLAPDKAIPLVPRTANYFALPQLYFPGAAAVLPQASPARKLTIVPLAWTSKDSWLAARPAPGRDPSFDARTDRRGPLAIGALVSAAPPASRQQGDPPASSAPPGTRLAVIANSGFAADRNFQNGNNGDLFLYTVNWLAQGTELIPMDRKVLSVRRLILSPEEARFLQLSSIGLLPLLLLLVGGLVWWRRR